MAGKKQLPTGTVTFLFTDIEGSTRAWEEDRLRMESALARHDEIVREAIEDNGGAVFNHTGDGVASVFASTGDALAAAVDVQRAVRADAPELKARVALHTGEAQERDGNYFGSTLNRVARLLSVGHGGQILVSQTTEEIASDRLPDRSSLLDLGDHRLRDLSRAIRVFQLSHPDLPENFPALRSLEAMPTNLPLQVSSFVGRDAVVADLSKLLDTARVVTLTGVGGVGKTRLAVHVGAEVLPRYPDGVWLCELASVTDPTIVADTTASVLGIQQERGESVEDALLSALRTKRVLLILDNCEHLLEPVARIVDRIVHSSAIAAVLATSREPLAVEGERVWPVRSLSIPPSDVKDPSEYASAQLFCDRAAAVRPDFVLGADNMAAVGGICARLDGVPLAIELAAARVRSMTPADIGSRLDERFRILTGGLRTAVERHRTLRATVDWSYDLLDRTERVLFDRLSVFSGGFTLDAVEAICGGDEVDAFSVVDLVTSLVDKSMVTADESAESTRYLMLETLRTYAQDRLDERGEADAVRRRHAEYFRDFAAEIERGLTGPDEVSWWVRSKVELANLRTAFHWAAGTGETDIAMQIVAPLYQFTYYGQQLEVFAWAERSLELPRADANPLRPVMMGAVAMGLAHREQFDEAAALADAAVELQGRPGSLQHHWPRSARVNTALWGSPSGLLELSSERLAHLRSNGEDYMLAPALMVHANALSAQGRSDEAVSSAEEALEIGKQIASPSAMGWGHFAMANALSSVDPKRAIECLCTVWEFGRAVGNPFLMAGPGVLALALAVSDLPTHACALRPMLESWDTWRGAGNSTLFRTSLGGAVFVCAAMERHESAAVLYGGLRVSERPLPPTTQTFTEIAIRETEKALTPAAFAAAVARGALMTDTELMAFALRKLTEILDEAEQGTTDA